MYKLLVASIIFSLALIVGSTIVFKPIQSQPRVDPQVVVIPTTKEWKPDSDSLFALIQRWRVDNGYAEYTEHEELCSIAATRAVDNANDTYDHQGFLEKYKDYPYLLSENITKAFSEEEALKAWLDSPAHRKALETNYKYSCVKCYGTSCIQIFSNF
jgi:uncharacterized protein YkwD